MSVFLGSKWIRETWHRLSCNVPSAWLEGFIHGHPNASRDLVRSAAGAHSTYQVELFWMVKDQKCLESSPSWNFAGCESIPNLTFVESHVLQVESDHINWIPIREREHAFFHNWCASKNFPKKGESIPPTDLQSAASECRTCPSWKSRINRTQAEETWKKTTSRMSIVPRSQVPTATLHILTLSSISKLSHLPGPDSTQSSREVSPGRWSYVTQLKMNGERQWNTSSLLRLPKLKGHSSSPSFQHPPYLKKQPFSFLNKVTKKIRPYVSCTNLQSTWFGGQIQEWFHDVVEPWQDAMTQWADHSLHLRCPDQSKLSLWVCWVCVVTVSDFMCIF